MYLHQMRLILLAVTAMQHVQAFLMLCKPRSTTKRSAVSVTFRLHHMRLKFLNVAVMQHLQPFLVLCESSSTTQRSAVSVNNHSTLAAMQHLQAILMLCNFLQSSKQHNKVQCSVSSFT
jgi:hypothetical protein